MAITGIAVYIDGANPRLQRQADSPVAGDIFFSNGTDLVRLAIGGNNTHLRSNGSSPLWEEIDGDTVDIDFTPVNYTPDTSPPEAIDVDDLAAHLKGIDTALATGAAFDDENHVIANRVFS